MGDAKKTGHYAQAVQSATVADDVLREIAEGVRKDATVTAGGDDPTGVFVETMKLLTETRARDDDAAARARFWANVALTMVERGAEPDDAVLRADLMLVAYDERFTDESDTSGDEGERGEPAGDIPKD